MPDKPTCFIIMPITVPDNYLPFYGNDSEHFIHVMEHLFIPAIEEAGFKPHKPIATGAEVIHGEIIQNVEQTDLVLCDMSTLNPNVFFELGMRTSLNKAICLVKDNFTKNIPFDISTVNYHIYDSIDVWKLETEKKKLITHIKKSYDKKDNSLWKYFSLGIKGTEVKPSGEAEKIDYILAQLGEIKEEFKPKSSETMMTNYKRFENAFLGRIKLVDNRARVEFFTNEKLVSVIFNKEPEKEKLIYLENFVTARGWEFTYIIEMEK